MKKTLIIAEAGVNHNGDINLAKDLIKAAAKSGADIIKFQTFKADQLVIENAAKANYQKDISNLGESQLSMLKKLELSQNEIDELISFAGLNNIEFLSTAFDLESLDYLIKLKLKRFKIPSGEITNLPYLRIIGAQNKLTIMSTGMANLEEISSAISTLIKAGLDKELLTILHCTSEYPASYNEVNLNAMRTLNKNFGVNVGYSDHTEGIEIAIASVVLGAKIIEKHITLDRSLPGPDHSASLEPDQFLEMVKSIRNIEVAMGNGIKQPTKGELENRIVVRKSIYASKDIKKGNIFNENNIIIKRPEGGLSPMDWDKVIGKQAKRNFLKDDLINF